MRKFYAFLAAALISVCAFASKEEVPSDAVLANYYEPGQVCACIYVPNDIKCYDIVFVGTYNDWNSSASACKKFEPVENYDGWYVVAVDDDGLPEDPEKAPYDNLQGKPVQLDANGDFNWDYQVGAATYIRGGAQIVQGGVAGEIDIKEYGTDAPNVYTVEGWKKDPCAAVYNSYTVAVINDGCDGFAVPFIIGSFNNWKFQEMQVDIDKTNELGTGYYFYSFRAAAGAEYQIVSGLMDSEGTIVDVPAWADKAYMQEFVDGQWARINGGANFVLGEQAEIVYDLRQDNLRWTRCAPDEREDVVVTLTAPAGAPAIVEVIGSFDDWTGSVMTLGEDGKFTATVRMQASDEFKFRSGVGETSDDKWKVQIQVPDAENESGWKDMDNQKVDDWWDSTVTPKTLNIDLSAEGEYRWTPSEQGIENVVLTEKAQKVVVDGVLYIVRDNKLFNLQGAQVR